MLTLIFPAPGRELKSPYKPPRALIEEMASPTFEGAACSLCQDAFDPSESVINSGGELWHQRCFV